MFQVVSAGADAGRPVSFVEKLAGSDAFRALFREGMTLVEDAAAYLDGEGRAQAKGLARQDALAYASESMRLTTRLMQLASWLLLQRAVNEGEMSAQQAASEKHKVKLNVHEVASGPETFHRLPGKLRDLVSASMRLQARIIHLDQLIYARPEAFAPTNLRSPVADQLDRLRQAFPVSV
jgi:regulator of CtrA degradation